MTIPGIGRGRAVSSPMSLGRFGSLLVAAFLTATALRASSVTSSASTLFGFDPSLCGPPGHTGTGETSAFATDTCSNISGAFAFSLVTSNFESFVSNGLMLDLHAFTPLAAGNFYANGTASWTEDILVTGGTGSGWLAFGFANAVSPAGGVSGISGSCTSTFNGTPEGVGCGALIKDAAFTFGVPLTVSFSISAFAFADGVDPSVGGALDTHLIWSVSLSSVGAYTGRVGEPGSSLIAGANIQLIPEPATCTLILGGSLLLVLWAKRRLARIE